MGRLAELRRKPPRERRNISASIAIAVVIVLFAVWATTLPARFDETVTAQQETPAENQEIRSVFSDIRRMAGQAIAPIRELIGQWQ